MGIINLLNGLFSAGDTVIERVVGMIISKKAVTALRMALIFGNLLTCIHPDKLHEVISRAKNDEPPSLMSIAKQALSNESRRGMAAGLGLLAALGEATRRFSQYARSVCRNLAWASPQ